MLSAWSILELTKSFRQAARTRYLCGGYSHNQTENSARGVFYSGAQKDRSGEDFIIGKAGRLAPALDRIESAFIRTAVKLYFSWSQEVGINHPHPDKECIGLSCFHSDWRVTFTSLFLLFRRKKSLLNLSSVCVMDGSPGELSEELVT